MNDKLLVDDDFDEVLKSELKGASTPSSNLLMFSLSEKGSYVAAVPIRSSQSSF